MASEKIRYELRDKVAVVTMDDGKANALSLEMIDGLRENLQRAEREAAAVVLTGRPGRFSGGFDLDTMRAGPEQVRKLVMAGAELMLAIYTFPRPVVVACSGHAMAAGAIVLLVADVRIGAVGDFKIALNEVAIGLTLPMFAVELARDRLSKRHFTRAATQSRVYDPASAVDAGFLDATERPDALLEAAFASASSLSALDDTAFRWTKERERSATVELIRAHLEDDIGRMTGLTR